MEKGKNVKFALLVIAILIIAFSVTGFKNQTKSPEELVRIRYSTVPIIQDAPSGVAQANGYFKKEGLEVEIKLNVAGKESLRELFNGEADIITVAQTPIIRNCFIRNDFYIIGSMDSSNKTAGIVARKDKGIQTGADLTGKRIAIYKGTSSEFFLDSFLAFHGVDIASVEILNMKPAEGIFAIENGDIDAFVTWQPHLMNALKTLGDNAVNLPNENLNTAFWALMVKKDYAEKNPEVLQKFLRAILKAEDFIHNKRDRSITIHSEYSNEKRETIEALWDDINFNLSLNEALLTILEDQARWLIRYNYVDKTKVPNILNYIYFDALEKVEPNAVTIIR